MDKTTAKEYKALCEAVLRSCEKSKSEEYNTRLYKLTYTFIKTYTGASAYMRNGEVIATVDNVTTAIKLPGNEH